MNLFLIFCLSIRYKTMNCLSYVLINRGEELNTQMGFFCSVNFGQSIYSSPSQRNVSGSLKSTSSVEFETKKIFFEFRFFRGVIED